VASLRSTSAQAFFVNKLLSERSVAKGRDTVLLLIGLLRDAIEPAEAHVDDIIKRALKVLLSLKDLNDLRSVNSAFRAWVVKSELNLQNAVQVWDQVFDEDDGRSSLILALIRPAIGLPNMSDYQKTLLEGRSDSTHLPLLQSLILSPARPSCAHEPLIRLNCAHTLWAMHNSEANAAASIGLCLAVLLDGSHSPRLLLAREVALLSTDGYGPHYDHGLNLLALSLPALDIHPALLQALKNALTDKVRQSREDRYVRALAAILGDRRRGQSRKPNSGRGRKFDDSIEWGLQNIATQLGIPESVLNMKHQLRDGGENINELRLMRAAFAKRIGEAPNCYWDMLRSSEIFGSVIKSLKICLGIQLSSHWQEALRVTLDQMLPQAIGKYFDQKEWGLLAARLSQTDISDNDIDFAAWLILFDIWVWARKGYDHHEPSPFANIIEAAHSLPHPILEFALTIRNATINPKKGLPALRKLLSKPNPIIAELLTSAGWPLKPQVTVSPPLIESGSSAAAPEL
jgi:hypothetical protein